MIDVRVMRAAGFTDEQIARAIEAHQQEAINHKREQTRIRVQNHRSRNAVTRANVTVTPKSVTPTLNLNENSSVDEIPWDAGTDLANTSSSTKEDKFKESKRRKVGFVCPLDFKPDDGDYRVGAQYGFSNADIDGKAAGLVEWSHANQNRAIARKSNWHLALRGNLRRDGKRTADPGANPAAIELARRTEEYKKEIAARKAKQNGSG